MSFSVEDQSEIIEAFSSTSRYLDQTDFTHPPPPPPQNFSLNKANSSDTEAAFLDLHLSVVDRFVSCKIYDKRDDFENVNFPFLDGAVPRVASVM